MKNKVRIESQNIIQWEVKSKFGTFYLVASEIGLQGVLWKKRDIPLTKSLNGVGKEFEILNQTLRQLSEYSHGKRKVFDLPLDVIGTDFQKQVWSELGQIPYGETRSYRDIARALKNEKAVRAVGAANGRNPISIIVPCHRVIGANGTLTGYAGGLAAKTKLLELEKLGLQA
jgi:methylated-DNA-[protein]-cysteine S-methyltransferase